jgi:hypothetical protein
MKLAIMQPYFLPYVGYFQLINSVDCFVIYDDIQFSKKSWVNRNRILVNGQETLFSIPLKKASDYLDICERNVAEVFDWRKIYRQFEMGYKKSPNWDNWYPIVEKILSYQSVNLFDYVNNSVTHMCDALGITTRIIKSSDLKIDRELKGKDRVIETCKVLKADIYINPIGGQELYSNQQFQESGIELNFIKSSLSEYPQLNVSEFSPALSVIDMAMNCSPDLIKHFLNKDFVVIK